ncbi:MAG: YfhO family protein [Gemmatimonadaceae bacterium]
MKKPAEPKSAADTATPPPVAMPVPRLAGLVAVAVHFVAALVLSYPAVTGKLLLNPRSDQFIAGYAFRDFARQHWLDYGSIPQWNPYLFGGMPFVDAMHGDTFYPTALLRLLIGTGSGMTWGLIIHVFLAGVFAHVFLRAVRLSFFAALAGGVAYQMGGNIAGLVSPGHDGKLFVAALLPLALVLVVRGVRDGRHWAWGPLAIVVGLAVLSPHPQLLQYMLLVTGAFALFLTRGLGSDVSDPPVKGTQGFRRLGLALGAVALGLMMGAIQFWPVTKYTAWSPRAGGIGYDSAVSYSLPPEEILNFALPQFSGILDGYWGRNLIHLHSEYIGVVVLVLAGLAFGSWVAGAHKRLVWFFVGTFVVSLLWALGGFTPFYRLVYAIVPGTKFFRAPSTMLYVVAFSVSVLTAFGVERLLRGQVNRGYLLGAAGFLVLLGMFAVSGLLTNSALAIAGPQMADAVLANEPALKGGAMRMMMFGLLACGAAFLIGTKRLSRDLAGALLVALIAADLWSVVRHYFIFSPPARELYATDPTIEYLQKQPGPFRVATLWPSKGNGRDVFLRYDGLMVHRIPTVLGYHGNHIGTYDLLTGDGYPPPQLGNPNFWRLANVQFFMSDLSDFPIAEAKRVLGPVKNAEGNDIYLHQLPTEASYGRITPAIVKTDETSAAQTVLDPRFDVSRAALFDTSARVQGSDLEALPEPLAIKARVVHYQPGRASIELDAAAPKGSALVISENYYPGWTAMVDGKPAVVGRANVSLIGVALPEGGRRIELEFVNGPYKTGRTVTWIAVALALAAWAAGAVTSKRQQASG